MSAITPSRDASASINVNAPQIAGAGLIKASCRSFWSGISKNKSMPSSSRHLDRLTAGGGGRAAACVIRCLSHCSVGGR